MKLKYFFNQQWQSLCFEFKLIDVWFAAKRLYIFELNILEARFRGFDIFLSK